MSTSADPNVRLTKDDGISKAVNPELYQSMVGSLLYAGIATRSDISHAVGAVFKFISEPSESHLTVVKRIFCYLKGTTHVSIKYRKSKSEQILGYSDVDHPGDLNYRHSTSGNVRITHVQWSSELA